jgi:hypothetical protein
VTVLGNDTTDVSGLFDCLDCLCLSILDSSVSTKFKQSDQRYQSIRLGIIVPNLLNPIVAVEDSNYDKDSSTISHCLTTIGRKTSICSKNAASEILVVTISFRQTG